MRRMAPRVSAVWLTLASFISLALAVGGCTGIQNPSSVPGQLTPGVAADVGMSGERLNRIATTFKKEVDEGRLPGAVIAVARRGKLVYHEAVGYQDAATRAPMTRDSIFRIYSMTKPLASVAAMMLVEDGVIQLTDPVAKFLPAFQNQQVAVARTGADGKITHELTSATQIMTVHDLLRHTAGIGYGEVTPNPVVKEALQKAGLFKPNVIDFDTRDLTPSEFTARVAQAPLVAQPGTIWQYSLATDVLGRVVEAASGKRLGEFLDERMFKPLSMADSGFYVPANKMTRLAQPFARPASGPFVSPQIDVSRPPGNDSGGAGGVSTAIDYLRFTQAMLSGGVLDSQRILARPTVELMMSDHLGARPAQPFTPSQLLIGSPQGYGFGLGFMVRTNAGLAGVPGNVGEGMWAGYGGTYFWIDPKEQLVAVFMSQGPAATRAYYRKTVKQLVYNAIAD